MGAEVALPICMGAVCFGFDVGCRGFPEMGFAFSSIGAVLEGRESRSIRLAVC